MGWLPNWIRYTSNHAGAVGTSMSNRVCSLWFVSTPLSMYSDVGLSCFCTHTGRFCGGGLILRFSSRRYDTLYQCGEMWRGGVSQIVHTKFDCNRGIDMRPQNWKFCQILLTYRNYGTESPRKGRGTQLTAQCRLHWERPVWEAEAKRSHFHFCVAYGCIAWMRPFGLRQFCHSFRHLLIRQERQEVRGALKYNQRQMTK